jgi:glyceraldehyde 3-phosphate dehydrogenase
MVTIGINGLGRIGRSVLRALEEQGYNDIKVAAVNDLAPIESLTHLLKYDSVHGRFNGGVSHSGNKITFGRQTFEVTQQRNPADIGWDKFGVDIVLECTGLFTTEEKLKLHLDGGAKRVILSAPPKDDVKTVVFGVNHQTIGANDLIISNGSCTTNCLAPLAKILNDTFGIESGFMTTVHSYTNDQNIVDAGHADLRRARAAAMSMIPTSTGAAKALGAVLPELNGKLDGTAIRVPTPNVSIVDLTFNSVKPISVEAIKEACVKAANGAMKGVLDVCSEPLVSIDFTHNPHSSIVDLTSIHVIGGKLGRVASWYDNEWGFSCRMLEVARYLSEQMGKKHAA